MGIPLTDGEFVTWWVEVPIESGTHHIRCRIPVKDIEHLHSIGNDEFSNDPEEYRRSLSMDRFNFLKARNATYESYP